MEAWYMPQIGRAPSRARGAFLPTFSDAIMALQTWIVVYFLFVLGSIDPSLQSLVSHCRANPDMSH